eukprot:TRINITY_DN9372_c0_g1_i1.p1 TRINITY_DN9372_c0_g1~~TRINITY_DN9372_c0_g1_i1.p1  ORF type:complete len:481 (-),score=134.68 TRINITY_DN9372_c0_g1_i1:54-1496(-)
MTRNWTVDIALQSTREDVRWELLTISEKKQVFSKLQSEIIREEREERRRRDKQQQEDFMEMLLENDNITLDTTFREAMALVASDRRFILVDEIRRETFWKDFLIERSRRKRKIEEVILNENIDAYIRFLEATDTIDISTTWKDFQKEMQNDTVFKNLHPIYQLKYFKKHMIILEDEQIMQEKEEQREIKDRSKILRNNFRELLKKHALQKNIHAKSRWIEFRPLIALEDAFIDLLDAPEGSTPAELFYDQVDELYPAYHKDKKKIVEILKSINYTVDKDSSLDDYLGATQKLAEDCQIDPSNLKVLFEILKKKDQRKVDKIKKTAKNNFFSVLKKAKLTENSSWEQIKNHLTVDATKQIQELPLTDEEMNELFVEHLQQRKEKDDFDSSSEELEEGLIRERTPTDLPRNHKERNGRDNDRRDYDRRDDRRRRRNRDYSRSRHRRRRDSPSSSDEDRRYRRRKRNRDDYDDYRDRKRKRSY